MIGGVIFRSPRRRAFFLSLAILLGAGNPLLAAEGDCSFTRRPPATLKNMGPCEFDPETYSFKGTPAEQAACLARPVYPGGGIASAPGKLPDDFLTRVGTPRDLPKLADTAAYLQTMGFAQELGFGLPLPLSRANSGDENAPSRALLRHPRHQRAELHRPRLSRRHRLEREHQQPQSLSLRERH